MAERPITASERQAAINHLDEKLRSGQLTRQDYITRAALARTTGDRTVFGNQLMDAPPPPTGARTTARATGFNQPPKSRPAATSPTAGRVLLSFLTVAVVVLAMVVVGSASGLILDGRGGPAVALLIVSIIALFITRLYLGPKPAEGAAAAPEKSPGP